MAGTFHWYGTALEKMAEGSIDIDTDTFNLTLATSAYTPNQDTDAFRSTVTECGASGTWPGAGGVALSGGTFAYDAASNEYRITWSSPTAWTGATIAARHVVIYKVVGTAATDPLLAYASETGDITSTNGTFTVTLPSPTLKITAA